MCRLSGGRLDDGMNFICKMTYEHWAGTILYFEIWQAFIYLFNTAQQIKSSYVVYSENGKVTIIKEKKKQ